LAGFAVLIVDDSPADRLVLSTAVAELGLPITITEAADAEQGLSALGACQPDLVLLDINMPGMSGHDALAKIRRDARLKSIPVLMFTSSARDCDIETAYAGGANAYVLKPSSLDEYIRITASMLQFWFSVAVLPARNEETAAGHKKRPHRPR
jgi:two-component system, chemotaxis family, response regulator Rcp1